MDYKDRALVGSVIGTAKSNGISLSIDRLLSPRERRIDTGECSIMHTSGDNYSPAEETIIVFFERNIFGILRSSQAAPSHAAVAYWLNKFNPPQVLSVNKRWKASPIVRKDIYNSVIKKKGMKISEATVKIEPRYLADADFGVIDSLQDMLGHKEHGFTIAVTMQAGPQRLKQNVSTLEETVEKALNHKDQTEKISVKAKPKDGRQRVFNLLEDHVTYKIDLDRAVFETEGSDFQRIAIAEISSAYNSMKDVLLERVPAIESHG